VLHITFSARYGQCLFVGNNAKAQCLCCAENSAVRGGKNGAEIVSGAPFRREFFEAIIERPPEFYF
jgi:hypothetical protein